MTEGSVLAKKYLRGVDPIEIDSDDRVIGAALEMARV